jgi:hypothetical protein
MEANMRRPNMRRLILAGLLCLPGLVVVEPAQAETWCLRSLGSDAGVCAFPSARDCTQAAAFSAFGGRCERQAIGPATPDKRRSDRKRAQERPDRWWW